MAAAWPPEQQTQELRANGVDLSRGQVAGVAQQANAPPVARDPWNGEPPGSAPVARGVIEVNSV
eukprot:14474134-Alexandrium_andersonii.AAC.1